MEHGKVGSKQAIAKRDEALAQPKVTVVQVPAAKPKAEAKVQSKQSHAVSTGVGTSPTAAKSLCGFAPGQYAAAAAGTTVSCKQCAWSLAVLREQAQRWARFESLTFSDPRAQAAAVAVSAS